MLDCWTRNFLLALVTLFVAFPPLATAQTGADREVPVHRTIRTEGIRVDGVLDESDWQSVSPATGFILSQPTEGGTPSQRTEARVLYGSHAIYVGVMLYDTQPDQIRRILTRRDDLDGTDSFIVGFDSYYDRKTAFLFGVSAAGVQFDALFANNDDDDSWDAVWDSAVRMTPDGWSLEMAIPFSQLRFTEGGGTWGLEFLRDIPRTAEEAFWAPITSDEEQSGIVQLFGRLEGINGVAPRRPIQVTPYSLARANRFESADPGEATADYSGDVGVDFRMGLSSNVTLDATINPDFGQVEADPAELNLSTFETFFEERRPFFLEGTQIFDFTYGSGDGALLYTRRVGGSSPIIGATKVSGRLANGLSFGALGAATGDDFDPRRLYAAGRLKQEFGSQNYVGGAATAYTFAPGPNDRGVGVTALAAGADWDVRVADSKWKLEGSLAGSARSIDNGDPSQTGYALYVGFDKVRGFTTPGSGLRIYSPDFQINDVGRFRQTDLLQARLGGNHVWNRNQPFGPFIRFETGGFGDLNWSYSDGTFRGGSFRLFTGGRLNNYWYVNGGADLNNVGGYDVRETRGLGPIRNIRNQGGSVEISTDDRKRLRGYTGIGFGVAEDGGTELTNWIGGSWNASDRVELSSSAVYSKSDNATAWAANEAFVRTADGLFVGNEATSPDNLDAASLIDLGLSGADADALLSGAAAWDGALSIPNAQAFYLPVFGFRDTRDLSLTSRANIIFHPKLSLQLYGQVFAARGRYSDFMLLADPDNLRDFDYPKRRDFSFESFHTSAVLRWEYRPGSAVFVVWTQSRNLSQVEELLVGSGNPLSPFGRSTGDQLRDTFDVFPENVFLVKVSYSFLR